MSSKLLEEAIVDAEALKEAALKSAQAAILEKYAPDVKKAIQLILEQEVSPMGDDSDKDDPLAGLESDSLGGGEPAGIGDDAGGMGGGGGMPMPTAPEGPDTSDTVNKIPMAATEGEKLCACPDEDEEIEINFDELERQMASSQAEDNIPDGMPTQEEEPQEGLGLKLQEEIELDEDLIRGLFENDELEDVQEEGTSCDEETMEEKKVVTEAKKTSIKVTHSKLNEKKDFSKNNPLIKENNQLTQVRKELLDENKKIKKAVNDLTKRLEEVNLSNAKLMFTNKALTSNSLNERQKTKIVEAISKAESVQEVNLIFETLQQTVGSGTKKSEPKSLNEAVSNKNTIKFPTRDKPSGNPVYNRMQEMAGIKKK